MIKLADLQYRILLHLLTAAHGTLGPSTAVQHFRQLHGDKRTCSNRPVRKAAAYGTIEGDERDRSLRTAGLLSRAL